MCVVVAVTFVTPSSCHLLFCRTSSLISSPQFFAWRWRDPPPPVYLQFALAGCRVASCGSTSTSTSRLYDALPASRVLLQQNICLSSYRGAAGFRDAIASCLLAPPPFASCSLAGCRDASRHVAAAASCPLKKTASFRDTVPSCLPLVCRLVVTLTPLPLLLLTCRLRLWARNLCLLTPLCLLSTGASPPVCLLFANWLLCCLSQRLRRFAPPFVALPPHV